MKRLFFASAAMLLILSAFLTAGSVSTANADESKVLEFNTMIGVPRPYTGATNAIRGVPGGGVPWVIEFARGKLSPSGSVDVLVKGLVIDPNEPIAIAHINDTVSLPQPCIAPIIFVTSGGGNWFAATGS